jgi:ArsR family transcriptional regulator
VTFVLLACDIYHYDFKDVNVIFFTIDIYMYVNTYILVHMKELSMVTPTLTNEVTQLHANICSGLADPRRILILYVLAEKPHNVSDIAKEINISQPAASRHLNLLRERGLVSAKREGQSVVYMLADQRIIEALDLLRSVLADNLKSQADLADTALKSFT